MNNYFRSLIFPSGKVNSMYKNYIGWSFISNIAVSAENVIAAHNMFSAMECNSETLRTTNYIAKDIIGQIGCVMYISKFGKLVDANPNKFLIYSNVMQQLSYVILYNSSSEYFLPIAGLANILSNISFIGFGSINAKCIEKLSNNNIGEIYAKLSVINTIGSSIGLCAGIYIINYVPVCVLPVLSLLRVYSIHKSVKNIL